MLNGIHHVAIICSDYAKSKDFYTKVLGLTIMRETFREARQSYKLDLCVNGNYLIELFSFPNPPKRLSRPEGAGLRHLAFAVNNLAEAIKQLAEKGVVAEPIRLDELTNKYFTFIADPDNLPIELYER
ncbi:Lactoylglutathione lyase [Legionella beliardensis]|uniref:Lactoylglutathione lyase n=1 Tax=Legionella beliardensis TaxID=91822 RepID=A0A378I5Z8_9GAMM|nr:VOC family protein [Legionella beliardensis]STX27894.1 Lactoylglutathione lyase [Legionella beliardensis]